MAWSGYILDLVAVAGFELGWAEVSQAAVQAGAVVPADVLGDGPAGSSSGDPGLQVDQLALDGAEEALGQGVDAPISVKLPVDLASAGCAEGASGPTSPGRAGV